MQILNRTFEFTLIAALFLSTAQRLPAPISEIETPTPAPEQSAKPMPSPKAKPKSERSTSTTRSATTVTDEKSAQKFAENGDKNLGNPQEAIKDYTQAIRLNPGANYPYERRGLLYEQLHQWEKAVTDYTHLIRLGRTDMYDRRGVCYRNLKQDDKP
jgi:tetratricopeptide (TPR) repeat protein